MKLLDHKNVLKVLRHGVIFDPERNKRARKSSGSSDSGKKRNGESDESRSSIDDSSDEKNSDED